MVDILIKGSNGITQVPINSKFLAERKIFIEGSIQEEMAMCFMKNLMYLVAESSKPISIYINSPGGQVNSGLLMYDVIVNCNVPVRTFCTGKAYSMAAILFACGNERYMLPNSELMIHQPILGKQVSEDVSSIKAISDTLIVTKDKINQILATHTGKTIQEIDEATSYEHYLTAEESIAFGLCDRVADFAIIMEG